MKKLFLLSIVLSLVCAINAQTTFTVPTPTMEQKLNTSRDIKNNYILACINAAKSSGMTAEEFGMKCGEAFIPAWDKDTGFDQIVNFSLYYWTCLVDDVQIIEQSNEKVVITIPHLDLRLEEQGVLFGVSLEDFITYIIAASKTTFGHFDVGSEMTRGEEGYRIVYTR
jgi:hypothetical protein